MPEYAPQLATLVKTPPTGDEWLHEIKFDGYRIGARVKGGRTTLYSRNGKDWTHAFPDVVRAIDQLGVTDALIDGEVASVLPDGRTSFQALQNAGETKGVQVVYFVFDLLRLEGERLEHQPLETRKARLLKLVGKRKTGRIRYSAHIDGNGRAFLAEACRMELEGIVSKCRDLPYKSGRHGGWVKTKCILRQEFVIGGFTEPEGSRVGLGALLIGHYDGDQLLFAGKVGTGFSHSGAIELRKRLESLAQPECPFTPRLKGALIRTATWVKPKLVCEVAFTEWTSDGKIRHPSFQGLRSDKRAAQVIRERPAAAPS